MMSFFNTPTMETRSNTYSISMATALVRVTRHSISCSALAESTAHRVRDGELFIATIGFIETKKQRKCYLEYTRVSLKVLCVRVLPVLVVFLAMFIGWLSTKEIPEGTMFATVMPLMRKDICRTTIFGPYATPLTPGVPDDFEALPRPTNEMFLNLPGGERMPAQGLGMCCRASAYDEETVRRTVLWYLY